MNTARYVVLYYRVPYILHPLRTRSRGKRYKKSIEGVPRRTQSGKSVARHIGWSRKPQGRVSVESPDNDTQEVKESTQSPYIISMISQARCHIFRCTWNIPTKHGTPCSPSCTTWSKKAKRCFLAMTPRRLELNISSKGRLKLLVSGLRY